MSVLKWIVSLLWHQSQNKIEFKMLVTLFDTAFHHQIPLSIAIHWCRNVQNEVVFAVSSRGFTDICATASWADGKCSQSQKTTKKQTRRKCILPTENVHMAHVCICRRKSSENYHHSLFLSKGHRVFKAALPISSVFKNRTLKYRAAFFFERDFWL